MELGIRIFEQIPTAKQGMMTTRTIKLNSDEVIAAINNYLIHEDYTYEDKLFKSYTTIENINSI